MPFWVIEQDDRLFLKQWKWIYNKKTKNSLSPSSNLTLDIQKNPFFTSSFEYQGICYILCSSKKSKKQSTNEQQHDKNPLPHLQDRPSRWKVI